jgi:ParB-like chromosome segregation protein Spo0J
MAKKQWKHGKSQVLPLDMVEENTWNPNEQTEDEFNLLVKNIKDHGPLDYPLVVPVLDKKGGLQYFRMISGAHRFRALKKLGKTKGRFIVADPAKFDETTQKQQTVAFNQIKGHMNVEKFQALVKDLVTSGKLDPNVAAEKLGFADESEFDLLIQAAREQIPVGARQEFDDKVKDAKSINEIYTLVDRLYRKYGETLPANWMILALGKSSRGLWLRIDGRLFKDFEKKGRECLDAGVTFDSVVVQALKQLDVEAFIKLNEQDLIACDDELVDIEDYFMETPLE